MLRVWKKLISIMLLALLIFSTGCGGNSGAGSTGGQDSAGTEPADKEGISIAMTDVSSLDPMKNWQIPAYYFYWTVYERLIKLNPATGEFEPELATSWEVADDGMSYTFHLREGVKWHDGSVFTSKDVKWSIGRGIENGTGNYPGVTSVDAPDDYTIVIHMEAPDSVFMDKQWTGDCCIMPYGCDDSIANAPNGTGPYKFVEWVSGDHITLARNENYWGEKAGCETIMFKIIPEASARLMSLQSGDVDVTSLEASDVKHVSGDADLLLKSATSISVNSLGFNCKSKYFSDVRVRQAVAYAIDKQGIIDGVLEGYGVPMETPVAVGKAGYYNGMKGYDYDPKKAKALLSEAGYPNGFDCEFTIRNNPLVAQLIQANLADVGINAKINQMESAAFLDYVGAGNGDIFLIYRSGGGPEIYVGWFDSAAAGVGGNRFFYSNPKMDELIKQIHLAIVPEKRNEVLKEVQELAVEELPLLPLYAPTVFAGMDKNIQGFEPDPEGCHDFRTISYGD